MHRTGCTLPVGHPPFKRTILDVPALQLPETVWSDLVLVVMVVGFVGGCVCAAFAVAHPRLPAPAHSLPAAQACVLHARPQRAVPGRPSASCAG